MKKLLLFTCTIAVLFSCRKRLDDFLFNPGKLESYKLDNYEGPVSLDVGSEYDISADKIHVFDLDMNFEGEDYKLGAIYVGDLSKISTDTVILYCHGNRDHMDFYWPRQKLYANLGHKHRFGVLMIDYPGYGTSSGKPTEENTYASVKTAMKWLKNQGLDSNRMVMMGFSLGTAPVCALTSRKGNPVEPKKIILEAPFASAEVMVQDASVLNFPSSYFVDLKIDNGNAIRDIKQPLLWIHGIADDFLSIETHGEIVFKNHTGLKTAVRVPGGGHETTPAVYGFENYLKAILEFIEQ